MTEGEIYTSKEYVRRFINDVRRFIEPVRERPVIESKEEEHPKAKKAGKKG